MNNMPRCYTLGGDDDGARATQKFAPASAVRDPRTGVESPLNSVKRRRSRTSESPGNGKKPKSSPKPYIGVLC